MIFGFFCYNESLISFSVIMSDLTHSSQNTQSWGKKIKHALSLPIIDIYLGRLYLEKFFVLTLAFLGIAFIFETIQGRSWKGVEILQRLPFLAHKILPFLFFLSIFWMIGALIHSHQWQALQSSGASFFRLLRAPFAIGLALTIFDLWTLTPYAQKVMNPFNESALSRGKFSLNPEGWSAYVLTSKKTRPTSQHSDPQRKNTPKEEEDISWKKIGYILDFSKKDNPLRSHFFAFNNQSYFLFHAFGVPEKKGGSLVSFKKGWLLKPESWPEEKKTLTIQLESPLPPRAMNRHPLFMALPEVLHAIESAHSQHKGLSLRGAYLLSHSLWSWSLILLAGAFMMGKNSSWELGLSGLTGIILCIFFYLAKEWVYALSLPLSFAWKPGLLWSFPIINLLLSMALLIERRQM